MTCRNKLKLREADEQLNDLSRDGHQGCTLGITSWDRCRGVIPWDWGLPSG